MGAIFLIWEILILSLFMNLQKKLIEESLFFKGQIVYVPYDMITNMFGAAHCCTQVFRTCQRVEQNKKENITLPTIEQFPVSGNKPRQSTNTVLMVAPTCFSYNIETAIDNAFMKNTPLSDLSSIDLQKKVLQEFSSLHLALTQSGVHVQLFTHETYHQTPDAVFPNNWFSTHNNLEFGAPTMILYPMKAISRRRERRSSIITHLSQRYNNIINLTTSEYGTKPHYLEGTGSIILDRINRIAYVLISERSHQESCAEWGKVTGYQLITFHASDSKGIAIYHTNVALSIGTTIAIICADSIQDQAERTNVLNTLKSSGKEIILISLEQMSNFCGNVLELSTKDGEIIVMSTTAYNNFTLEQKTIILKHVKNIVHADISLIETIGGGSVRCTLAELF